MQKQCGIVRRGALAAVLDLVKTALAIQGLKNTLGTLPFAVVTEVMGIEVPGLSLEKVDDLKNMAYGAVAALQDPPRVFAALGQKIGDTVEEEGIAYSISYVAADVAIQILRSKGLSEVKNVSKADELADVAKVVDKVDDITDAAVDATSRPSYGKGQIEQVWENAKDPVTGKVYDPSGVEITWDPSKPRNGQWDMGHIPGEKYSDVHQLYMDDVISKEEFLEWYRNPDNYRPEFPTTNRGHKYE